MKIKRINNLFCLIIALLCYACNSEDMVLGDKICRYTFKIELTKNSSDVNISDDDLHITYEGNMFKISDYKPESPITVDGAIVPNYGAYYTFKSDNKSKISFGEVDLFFHKDCSTQIELHIGEDTHTINVKYSLDTENIHLYLDGVLVDDDFVSIKY